MQEIPRNTAIDQDLSNAQALANRKIITGAMGVLIFSGLTFIGANIRIPLQPVPITLQTLFVLLSGAVIGAKLGTLAEASYVAMGIVGIPVFAGTTSGVSVLAGPTGGYILGFVAAPPLVGRMIKKSSSFRRIIFTFSLGTLVILFLGALHLTLFYTHDLGRSLQVGILPFLPGDAFKIVAAASIYRSYTAVARSSRLL